MKLIEQGLEEHEKALKEEIEYYEGAEESAFFEEALEKAGNWGYWQKKLFVIAAFSQVFTALHCVSAVFLSATPDHWCHVPGTEYHKGLLGHQEGFKSLAIPRSNNEFSKCSYYDHSYDSILQLFNSSFFEENLGLISSDWLSNSTIACSTWTYDTTVFESTVVTEWALVCGRKWLAATVQASFMAGLLFGSLFLGQISDGFGRRTTALISAVVSCVVAILTAFMRSYTAFLALRFIIAAVGPGLMVTNFVLIMEVVKPQARTTTGMLYAFPFGMGIAILPGIAYFIRDWRMLQLAIGLSSTVLLSYYWILPESPRWLTSKGRHFEALDVLKQIAKGNGRALPSDEDMLLLLHKQHSIQQKKQEQEKGLRGMVKGQVDLLRTKTMRRRCLVSFFMWFVASMVYYGLTFSGSNIKADLFVMVFASGVVEIPSFFLVIFLLQKTGRRLTASSLFLVCGLACLATLGVPRDYVYVNFTLANIGKFFNAAVFQLCYIYTSELSPTTVRNIAVGTSSMVARVGSSIAPYIVDLLGAIHYAIPSTVFGLLSLGAGLLTLLLPETGNKKLPETLEEVEYMAK